MRGRIRTIKPEAFTDEKLWDAEEETGLPLFRGFVGLWTQADREGLFEWRPRPLKAAILPYWDGDFSRVLDALATRGFVRKYVVDGREFGVVVSFTRHQSINNKEEASKLPAPPEPPPETPNHPDGCTRDERDDDARGTREARDDDAPLSFSRGTEGKGTEGKGREPVARGGALPSRDALVPIATRLDVVELHAAWKEACGYPNHKFRNGNDLEARMLADAIDAHGLPDCLLVAKYASNDGMVTGKADERGQKHDTIKYVFDNPNTFHRILRDAQNAEGKSLGKSSAADAIAKARAL